jgi:hypothetical protein
MELSSRIPFTWTPSHANAQRAGIKDVVILANAPNR